jgi:hypothetical protein
MQVEELEIVHIAHAEVSASGKNIPKKRGRG